MPTALKKPTVEFDSDKQEILSRLGDISEVEIAQNEVLIAVYFRPKKVGRFYMPDENLKEDKYQGKTGLVVKIGSACRFQRTNPDTGVTYGLDIRLHDWVVTRTSDTWPFEINTNPESADPKDFVFCRLVYDDQIRMRVPRAGMVW
jgi:hypothetical protein